MSFDVNKISEGLNNAYKSKPTKFAKFNNKTVNAEDVKGSNSFDKIKKSLKLKEEDNKDKQDKYNVEFKEEFTNNRKYIDEIMMSDNANNKALFLNVLNKRKAELNGYLITGSKAHEKQIVEEIKSINSIFEEYKDVISLLERNGVIQKSNSNNLFRID